MFGCIFACVASFALGFGTHALHKRIVAKAVAEERSAARTAIRRLRSEVEELRAERDNVQHLSDCADAMRRGKEIGRYSPATQAEKFAKTFADRSGNTTFVRTDKQSA